MNPPTIDELVQQLDLVKSELRATRKSVRRVCFGVWVIIPLAFLLAGVGLAMWGATQQQGGNVWACVAMFAVFSAAMVAILVVLANALSETRD